MRRVIVTGSRRWVDRTTIWCALNQELQTFGMDGLILLHGGAGGADDIADRWAYGMNSVGYHVEIETFKPDYLSYGRMAYAESVGRLVRGGADVCHAFPLEGSTGARHTMSRCYSAGIRVVNHGFQPYTIEAREFVRAYG